MNKRIIIILAILTILSINCRTLLTSSQQDSPILPATSITQKASQTITSIPATSTPTNTQIPPTRTPTYTPYPTCTPTPTSTPTARPTPSAIHHQVFNELWTAIKENYLYQDFNGLDWDAVKFEHQKIIDSGLTDQEFYMLMRKLVIRLGDDHSTFFDPDEVVVVDAETSGEYKFIGIGILGTIVESNDFLTVIITFPGGPADKAGIKAHDNILSVDNMPIIDDGEIRFDLIRGPAGSTIELLVQSPSGEPRKMKVLRKEITGGFPVPYSLLDSPQGKQIGYIFLASFRDSNIDDKVKQILEEFGENEPVAGLIIDNRYNRGGGSDVLTNLLSYFIDGKAGYFVQRDQERLIYVNGKDIYGSQTIPLVVLTGPDTASFGEIFAGILKDLNRAYLIGIQTEGNVEVLHIYNFSDGSRAWIAQESFRPFNFPEEEWEQSGIIPHQIISSSWDEFTFENDPVIYSAVQYFDEN